MLCSWCGEEETPKQLAVRIQGITSLLPRHQEMVLGVLGSVVGMLSLGYTEMNIRILVIKLRQLSLWLLLWLGW